MPETIALFLLQAAVISISGVMVPGPVTAATLAAGTRARHAGALIAVGHGIVEFPLMFLIMAGMGALLASQATRIGIGLAGGAFLVFMGGQMIRNSAKGDQPAAKAAAANPVWTGVILTGGNPYFLLWWATIGLALATRAIALGVLAFGLFTIVHWLCDLVWLEALSVACFKGSRLIGPGKQRIVLIVCGVAVLVFGLIFVWDAAKIWVRPAA
jgi:threonine/homoserine/homoserine lactone efflux protein